MWAPIMNILLGLWLIVSPNVFEMNQMTSDNNYIIGPLVISFSIISLWKINRNAVRINIVFGAWILMALLIFDYSRTIAFFSNGACGSFIILFSAIKRKTIRNFGGGWRSLLQKNPLHLREAEKTSAQQQ